MDIVSTLARVAAGFAVRVGSIGLALYAASEAYRIVTTAVVPVTAALS